MKSLSTRRTSSGKRLSYEAKMQLFRVGLFLVIAAVTIFIIVIVRKLPLYVLEARLKDFAGFDTRLDTFDFNLDGEVKLNRFIVSQDGEVVINEGGSEWNKLSNTNRWDKKTNSLTTEYERLSPADARQNFLLFEPHALNAALEAKNYWMVDVDTPEGVITEIHIPGDKIKDIRIKQYMNGYQAVSNRANKESCLWIWLGILP